jgi:membrane associated rhomboid family serine protease
MSSKASFQKEVQKQITVLITMVAIFWVIEIVNVLFFHNSYRSLAQYGIIPRNFVGLRGILFAPFLHGGWGHLIANTIPFLTLGWLVMLQETSDFFIVTIVTMLVGGLGTWLFGAANSVHIGASILIYGYLGFLLLRGYFQKNIPSIFLSVVVFFIYGGLIWGVLPSQIGISWQGHLFGFLGGVLSAFAIAKEKGMFPYD